MANNATVVDGIYNSLLGNIKIKPATHTHTSSDVTDLNAALNTKATTTMTADSTGYIMVSDGYKNNAPSIKESNVKSTDIKRKKVITNLNELNGFINVGTYEIQYNVTNESNRVTIYFYLLFVSYGTNGRLEQTLYDAFNNKRLYRFTPDGNNWADWSDWQERVNVDSWLLGVKENNYLTTNKKENYSKLHSEWNRLTAMIYIKPSNITQNSFLLTLSRDNRTAQKYGIDFDPTSEYGLDLYTFLISYASDELYNGYYMINRFDDCFLFYEDKIINCAFYISATFVDEDGEPYNFTTRTLAADHFVDTIYMHIVFPLAGKGMVTYTSTINYSDLQYNCDDVIPCTFTLEL